jgi:hypothetical protein
VTLKQSGDYVQLGLTGYNVTNAELDLGGRGSDTIDFRNKEQISLTLDYFLDTNWGTHQLKAGYTKTENERLYNLAYTGDGAQYTSIGTQNTGATVDSYMNDIWTGDRDFSEDDIPRLITGMASSSDSAYFLSLLDTDNSGVIDEAEVRALTFGSTAGNPNSMVNVYRIAQTEQSPLAFYTKGKAFFVQDS